MNKRAIIELCLSRMTANENAGINFHAATEKAYNECMITAINAGYTASCFNTLWVEACKRHARTLNVKEG